MEPMRVTSDRDADEQLLYFTTSSLTADDRYLIFIRDTDGNPNIFCKDQGSGAERQLTFNTEGTLKSYVYFNGNEGRGLGKASISLDSERHKVYFLQGPDICVVDLQGTLRILNRLPADQVTAFTHPSADGKRLCVPTTDARALAAEGFVNDGPGYQLGDGKKNEVISGKPDYDIDERVRTENLRSYLRVYDTATGAELLCEPVRQAWITHVQFRPHDAGVILYNHEWAADCGIRRLWVWNGHEHVRLRNEGEQRRKEDWVCHEMWQVDGKYIIYHGKYQDGTAFVGRVSPTGGDNREIRLPAHYRRYGHFTAGNQHNDWLVSDGYYHPDGQPENENWGGEWISVQRVDWERLTIEWLPLCEHRSLWDCQDSHPHPIFDHADQRVYFTSNRDGKRAVFRVGLADKRKRTSHPQATTQAHAE